tara:strand:+ start:168 stop:398 length:231 start_codon:yes stop_codon:yes gene_type:complete
MTTGIAIGYLLGTAVAFVITFLFGVCCWINDYEQNLAKIYDPATLDINADNDTTGAQEKDGRRNENETADKGNQDK